MVSFVVGAFGDGGPTHQVRGSPSPASSSATAGAAASGPVAADTLTSPAPPELGPLAAIE